MGNRFLIFLGVALGVILVNLNSYAQMPAQLCRGRFREQYRLLARYSLIESTFERSRPVEKSRDLLIPTPSGNEGRQRCLLYRPPSSPGRNDGFYFMMDTSEIFYSPSRHGLAFQVHHPVDRSPVLPPWLFTQITEVGPGHPEVRNNPYAYWRKDPSAQDLRDPDGSRISDVFMEIRLINRPENATSPRAWIGRFQDQELFSDSSTSREHITGYILCNVLGEPQQGAPYRVPDARTIAEESADWAELGSSAGCGIIGAVTGVVNGAL